MVLTRPSRSNYNGAARDTEPCQERVRPRPDGEERYGVRPKVLFLFFLCIPSFSFCFVMWLEPPLPPLSAWHEEDPRKWPSCSASFVFKPSGRPITRCRDLNFPSTFLADEYLLFSGPSLPVSTCAMCGRGYLSSGVACPTLVHQFERYPTVSARLGPSGMNG